MAKAKVTSQPTVNDSLKQLEIELEKIFVGKAPALSPSIKELLVKVIPWLACLSMIALLPVLLGIFGISVVAMPVSFLSGLHTGFSYMLSVLFLVAMVVLNLMAIPGLFRRELRAWRLMFYSTLLSLAHNLITFDLGGLVIGGAIGCYFLFQLKSKYTK